MYGTASWADVRAVDVVEAGVDGIRFTVVAGGEHAAVALHMLGRHNVSNALAAIAVGWKSGMSLADCADAVGAMRAPDKRGVVIEWQGVTIVNDCYNSNPAALDAMVDAMMAIPASRHIVVAGEMLELGPSAPELHKACGLRMMARGVDVVVSVRGNAREFGGTFFDTPLEAGEWMKKNLLVGDAVLLKASRGVRLEGALEVLFNPISMGKADWDGATDSEVGELGLRQCSIGCFTRSCFPTSRCFGSFATSRFAACLRA
jgi:UDP-N-acetylmuramoyl-tripeptide--D-alanyl-D-alanine ligase